MLFFYKILTSLLYPFFLFLIFFRKLLGKEDSIRYKEKIFQDKTGLINQDKLIWFHGASLGEISSATPLIRKLIEEKSDYKILITSSTFSSAQFIKKKFEKNKKIIHKYFPLDVSFLAKKFIEQWNPSCVIFIDSEIWPNFLNEIKKKKIKLILINARITNKTFKKWMLFPNFAKKIFSLYDLCITSSLYSKQNLQFLGVEKIKYFGNLKFTVNYNNIGQLKKSTNNFIINKKSWCAASTHPGEEEFLINTHLKIKNKYKDIITIIIPRHTNKFKNIIKICNKLNLKYQIINDEKDIKINSDIIIVNAFGLLPKYFNICKNVFIGKSLLKKFELIGGQNPIEPAKLGCKVYHGPYVSNFKDVYDLLNSKNISELVNTSDELSNKIINNFKYENDQSNEIVKKLNIFGSQILLDTSNEIKKLL